MAPQKRVEWLDSVSPTGRWKFGDDVFCLHCDGIWKAEDITCDHEGDPTCPVCSGSSPIDFHHLPWWRDDLVAEKEEYGEEDAEGDRRFKWIRTPLEATAGQPRKLPSVSNN